MKEIRHLFVSLNDSVLRAIEVIDEGAVQVALVVDGNGILHGTVTDGDIRRGLLKGVALSDRISAVVHPDFRSVSEGASRRKVLLMMRQEELHQVPVLDATGRVVELLLLIELLDQEPLSNWVILMAGGEGRRLLPLTRNQPKPMLGVGGRPLLQIALEGCASAGFRTIFISVNYLKQQIIDHFGDGSAWMVDVKYLEEDHPLGTAGPLGLLPHKPEQPVVVINGDVLSRVDLRGLLRFHGEHAAAATLCVRSYETQIPFGVVQVDGIRMQAFQEKPKLTHFVSAGVYVLNPELLALVPAGQPLDMPELLTLAKQRGFEVAVFPIHEYWLDVGDPSSLEQANGDWL
jgi:dTDP-glucose pyrophosphorylase